jgi:glycerol-3-phosphate dehydrogenase
LGYRTNIVTPSAKHKQYDVIVVGSGAAGGQTTRQAAHMQKTLLRKLGLGKEPA